MAFVYIIKVFLIFCFKDMDDLKPPAKLTFRNIDFVLFYAEEDAEEAERLVALWRTFGIDGCRYDDTDFLEWKPEPKFDTVSYLCEKSSYQFILVTENLASPRNLEVAFLKNAVLTRSIQSQNSSVMPIFYMDKNELAKHKGTVFFGLSCFFGMYKEKIEDKKSFKKMFEYEDVIEEKTRKSKEQEQEIKKWKQDKRVKFLHEQQLQTEEDRERRAQMQRNYNEKKKNIPEKVKRELAYQRESDNSPSSQKKAEGDTFHIHITATGDAPINIGPNHSGKVGDYLQQHAPAQAPQNPRCRPDRQFTVDGSKDSEEEQPKIVRTSPAKKPAAKIFDGFAGDNSLDEGTVQEPTINTGAASSHLQHQRPPYSAVASATSTNQSPSTTGPPHPLLNFDDGSSFEISSSGIVDSSITSGSNTDNNSNSNNLAFQNPSKVQQNSPSLKLPTTLPENVETSLSSAPQSLSGNQPVSVDTADLQKAQERLQLEDEIETPNYKSTDFQIDSQQSIGSTTEIPPPAHNRNIDQIKTDNPVGQNPDRNIGQFETDNPVSQNPDRNIGQFETDNFIGRNPDQSLTQVKVAASERCAQEGDVARDVGLNLPGTHLDSAKLSSGYSSLHSSHAAGATTAVVHPEDERSTGSISSQEISVPIQQEGEVDMTSQGRPQHRDVSPVQNQSATQSDNDRRHTVTSDLNRREVEDKGGGTSSEPGQGAVGLENESESTAQKSIRTGSRDKHEGTWV